MTITETTCSNAFGCLLADDSSGSNSEIEVGTTSIALPDTTHVIGNNNNSIGNSSNINNSSAYHPVQGLTKNHFSFPRRVPVDLEFQNVRYTVGRLSLSQKKYGKYDLMNIYTRVSFQTTQSNYACEKKYCLVLI